MTDYAQAVSSGQIAAGKWHRLACDRHLRDLKESENGGPWIFRPELAAKAFGIFGLYRHFKGEWAGQTIRLEPFQQFIVGSIMGWVDRATGRRRFRNAFVELPRGNGKSTIAGGLLVLFAFFLGEGGAEAYSVATKKDQARISFQAARQMLLRSTALKKHVTIGKYNVHSLATESKMEALGADADTLDGLRPFIVVVDEVHKLPHADLIEVMESGMGTRIDPMLFEITTAGDDDQSVYGQHHLLSTRVLDQTIPLEQWFAFIAAADAEDDWTSEETWRKANPNYGVSVKPDFMRKECQKALANPSEQPKFRRLYLGQKVQAVDGFFSLTDWRACPDLPDEGELLRAERCLLGLDLSSSIDITAAVLVWELSQDEIAVEPHFWVPEDNLDERSHRDRVPYRDWIQRGWITPTDGAVVDYGRVRRDVAELARRWNATVCFDPWHAPEMVTTLRDADDVPVLAIRQHYELLSPSTKRLQSFILQRRVRHNHNPLMTWMVSNAVPRWDEKGNVILSKKRSRGRIDGPQAIVNAVTQLPIRDAGSQVWGYVVG